MKRFRILALFVMLFAIAGATASQSHSKTKRFWTNGVYKTSICQVGSSMDDCSIYNYGPICTDYISYKPLFSDYGTCYANLTQYYLRSAE